MNPAPASFPRLAARRFPALLAVAMALAGATAALAETADRNRDALIAADHSSLDDLRQVTVLTGHVVLTKGSMRMAGDRMEHRQDEQGYQRYVVTAEGGGLASFHERRDPQRPGVESTIDGVAEIVEYDERTDTVRLVRRAIVKRFENGELRDELGGERIVYDARKSTYEIDGRAESAAPPGRVQMRIAPARGAADARKDAPLPLQPEREAPGTGPAR
jgi:lipopolysaccharide export system protein LptA